MRLERGVSVLSIFILCCSLFAFSQATTSLRGHVTDASGALIPGAQVKLTLTATGVTRQGVTDSSGEYQFLQLTPGQYALTVSGAGFMTLAEPMTTMEPTRPATTTKIRAADR
jgi:protocatechuate 3,4-dioxygenase beta subunit